MARRKKVLKTQTPNKFKSIAEVRAAFMPNAPDIEPEMLLESPVDSANVLATNILSDIAKTVAGRNNSKNAG